MNKQRKTKQEKGITLIALIITIVVLLILAVVAIRAVQGDGILSYAKNARDAYQKAQNEEETMLQNYLDKLNENNSNNNDNSEEETELEPGLYKPDGTFVSWKQLTSMDYQTISYHDEYSGTEIQGAILNVDENGVLSGTFCTILCACGYNYSSEFLKGELVIPNTVKAINENAFKQCELTSITIPKSVTKIGGFAFEGTPWLEEKQKENPMVIVNDIVVDGKTCTGDIIIPNCVKYISDFAFQWGANVDSVTIPNSVTYIGTYAFEGTPWLEEKRKENPLVIVNDIVIDGRTCTGDIIIPNNVKHISGEAFSCNENITSLQLSNNLKTIGYSAFLSCKKLTTITIPSNVTDIGIAAFDNNEFDSVYFEHTSAPKFGDICFMRWSDKSTTFYFKNSTVANAFKSNQDVDMHYHYNAECGTKSTNYNW